MKTSETVSTVGSHEPARLSRLLNDLFSRLDRMGISYCILRDYEGLPDRIGNDLDLLVHPADVASFRVCLLDAAAATGWQLLKNPERFRFRSYWLAADGGREVVHFDVWDLHHWKGICFAPNDAFLKKRIRFKQFYIIDPDTQAGSCIIKDLIQNGAVKDKYKLYIQEYAQTHSEQIVALLQRTLGKKMARWLTHETARAAWDTIDAKASAVRRKLVLHAFLKNPLLPVFGFAAFLWGHLFACLARPSGMFVVLVGPDGSGKSTVADKLQETLKDLFKGSRYFHGQFGLLPQLKVFKNIFLRLLGRTPPLPPPPGTFEAHNSPTHSLPRTLVYLFYYALDYCLGYGVVRRAQARGEMIIFDRYFYDWFIQGYYGNTPQWLLPLFKAVLPRPDLVIYLSNSPQTIHQRKPELTVEQIEQQSRKCRWIVENMSYAQTVSTDPPPEEVAQEIAARIVKIMAGRYHGGHK